MKIIFIEGVLHKNTDKENFIEIDDIYSDCEASDFDDDFTFNIEKYNDRKQKEIDVIEISKLKKELDSLSKDFIQVLCGAVISDFEQRKQLFITKHNRLRELENKPPRQYN